MVGSIFSKIIISSLLHKYSMIHINYDFLIFKIVFQPLKEIERFTFVAFYSMSYVLSKPPMNLDHSYSTKSSQTILVIFKRTFDFLSSYKNFDWSF